MLLNAGACPEARNHLNRTPLHFAARSGHPRILKMLLEAKGVSVNSEDSFGQTPLSVACDSAVVKFLKGKGGKINFEKEEMLAAKQGNRDISAPNSPNRSRSPSPRKENNRSRSPSPERSRSPSPEVGMLNNVMQGNKVQESTKEVVLKDP